MPLAKKVETQLLISPQTKLRGLRLAVVRGESLAEVWRLALEVGLPAMEDKALSNLIALESINSKRVDGRTEAEWLRWMIDSNINPFQETLDV